MHPKTGLWRGDAAKIETLNARREELLARVAPLERITGYWKMPSVTARYRLPVLLALDRGCPDAEVSCGCRCVFAG